MDKIFTRNLKTIRKSMNLTQKQVAEKLKVVESCYANWEQGRTEPSVSVLRELSKIFDVSVDDLLN
ncbi:MAG: helix-turn-helix transcriptional regulator [Clostridia bacterium]|nr:helix-turn-helix transcriptional regulator [Clostridia bacterium]